MPQLSPVLPPGARLGRKSLSRRARRHRARQQRRAVASLTTLALVAGLGLGVLMPSAVAEEFTPAVTLASASPVTTDDDTTRPEIIAGQDATYELSVSNEDAQDRFNTSVTALVPNGVSFTGATSPLGTPTVLGSGDPLPDSAGTGETETVPAGFQLWVWENVADLPAGATIDPTFTVRPDADRFPVGSDDLDIVLTAYTSNDPNLLPSFPGSTGVSTDDEHTSQPGTSAANTPVKAVRIHKDEPSAESELLRGVHDNTTTYTLRVLHTGEGTTAPITVTDYLPAGLEYLGGGGVDNTQDSDDLFAGNLEYPGAADLTATPEPTDGGYLAEDSVTTVGLSDAEATELGLGEDAGGVYTEVVWELSEADLAAGTPQDWDADAGEPGEFVIRYRAAVALFENTLDWDGDVPAAESGEQAANLNNNNGASTRHSAGSDDHTDATTYTNLATVSGEYQGDVAEGTPRAQTDSSTEVVDAVDLRILKSVADDTFVTAGVTTYTLDLATSEYTSAEDIVVTDTIGNGMCPVLPEQDGPVAFQLRTADGVEDYDDAAAWNEAAAPGDSCGYPNAADESALDGATLTTLLFDETTGEFEITLAVEALDAGVDHAINYAVRQNEDYVDAGNRQGPTSSGDSVSNEVEVQATTHAIDGLAGITGADGPETVWEDSEAWVHTEYTEITKHVLERNADIPGDDIAAADAWVDSTEAEEPFILGDDVWYRLTVDFPDTVVTRNPVVTDFLPQGVEPREDEDGNVPFVYSHAGLVDTVERDGSSLRWTLGTEDGPSDNLFVPIGTALDIYVPATVVGLSASADAVDMPQNLMKYQQENSEGDVFFLRDDASITVDHGMTLLKGVESVDDDATRTARSEAGEDGGVFGSDRDGIEVVHDETVTYRLDVTTPTFTTTDLAVWDVLPEGIVAGDIDTGSFTATTADGTVVAATTQLLAPGDEGYPAVGADYDERAVLAWTVDADLAPGTELTLSYDLTVPDHALVTQEYDNVAGIAAYGAVTNQPGGETVTYVPDGVFDRPVADDEHQVSGTGTSDDSQVYLPAPAIEKTLVDSEIAPVDTEVTDANNGAGQVVQGEYVTFDYSVTIPAGTAVAGGTLADDGVFSHSGGTVGYEPVSAELVTPAGGVPGGFALDPVTGELTFPVAYSTGATDETFTVELTVWVDDADASEPDHDPDLGHGTALTNTASFSHQPATGGTTTIDDTATAQYVEPNLGVVKTHDQDADVAIDSVIGYTLTVSNEAGRPTAYDNTVVDTVPAGLIVDPTTISADGELTGADPETGGGTITWAVDAIPGNESVDLTYEASIDPSTGGAETYRNEADVIGYTLPATPDTDRDERRGDRTGEDEATITAVDADIAKGVRIADAAPEAFTDAVSAPVGQTVEYQVEVTLHPSINYWDPAIVDTMPAGVVLQDATVTGPAETTDSGTVTGDWEYALDGDAVTWTYDGDLTSHGTERTLLVSYEALVTDAVAADSLPNTADFTWNRVDDDHETRESVGDDATVSLLHPELVVAKTVNNQDTDTVDPGETFGYRLEVTNDGDTAGHNLVVTDTVPEGVVVDAASISSGGVLTGADDVTGGGTITWDHEAPGTAALDGPLHEAGSDGQPQSIALTYEATLAPSATIADADTFTNTTRVTEWESFPTGGRSYDPSPEADAVVDPAFPHLTLEKAPTGSDTAYAGEPFGWTLTATNTGDSPANLVELTDTLPTNWSYTEVTSISVAGTAQTGDLAPAIDGQDLSWTFEGTPVLAPDASIQIAFLATPSQAALTEAGVGSDTAHTNTLAARATDLTDAEENGSGPYSDPQTPAEAFIHSADLELTKTAAVDEVVAGTDASTGWTITVANNGPDTAVGPFTVTDTTGALPDGMAVTGATGEGWVSGPVARDDDGTTTVELWRADPADTLAAGDSFAPIEVTVQVAADVEPTTVDNLAVVTSTGTHDPDPSNDEDEDPLPIVAQADLAVVKSLNTAEPNAGSPLTWQLDPTNLGPSVSRSSTAEPITITDVVPDGIEEVTVEAGTDWTAAASDGFPAAAGDTITFTYTGEELPVGAAGSITLTGTIDASWPAGDTLINSAVVAPGETEDPEPSNNEDDVPTTPGTETSLDIAKTRVVADGDGWQTASDAPVAGEPVNHLVTVANLGPADAQAVTVVDELPEYLGYASYESVTGTWARTDGPAEGDQHLALTEPSALAPGATASFVITTDLASAHTGAVVNWVEADADNSTNEPRDEDNSSSTRDANLSVHKEHAGDAVAGETLDYTITVTNEGPSSSSGPIVVEDVLPAGFSYVGDSAEVAVAGGPAAPAEPTVDDEWLSWTVGDDSFALATDETIVLTLTTAIADDVPAQTGLVNTAVVDGPEDSDPSDNRWPDPTDVVTRAEMTIDKTVEDGPWVAGAEVDYTFTVTNEGPSVADALVTDVWPAGLTGVSISGDGWDCEDATCESTGHPVGTSTLTVTGLVDQAVTPGEELTNTAELEWTDSRGTHEDEDPETIEVSALADLGLLKTAVDETGTEITEVTAGDTARFALEVTNHGPSLAAAPVTVVDTLPEGLTFVGLADATHWDATVDDQQVTLVLDDGETSLAAGAQAPDLTMIVQVDADLPVTAEPDVPALVNVADVSSPTEDPDPDNNHDEAPVEVAHSADLAIVKTHEGTATIDEDLSFDVVVTNHGPSTAKDVTVTETVPAGLEYVGIDESQDAWTQVGEAVVQDDGTTTVELALTGTIEVGAQAPALGLTTTVTAGAYPEVTNVVVVESPQPDPNPGDNEDEDPVPVDPDADLTIDKETLTDAPHAGRELTWQLTPTNLGPAVSVSSSANPITITDSLPAGVSDVEVDTGTDWTAAADNGLPAQAGDTITLTYVGADAMPVGDTAPVTLTGTIDPGFTGEITNAAAIEPGPTPDRDPDNNDSTVTDPVDDETSLDVVKTTVDPATGEVSGDPVDVVPGTQVTYELTVSNTGTADAREVTLVDELPGGLTFASFADVDPAGWTTATEAGATSVELALTGSLSAPEGQATVRITADVADDLGLEADEVTNPVTATAENVPEEEWPTDEVTDPLDPSADLSITKSHTGATVAGTELQYTLLVTNHGPSVSPGPVTVTDVLPEGLSYVADSARVIDPDDETTTAEPAVDGQQLTWTVEETAVPVGGTMAVTFEALVAADVPATDAPDVPALVNTGEVSGPIDDNPDNDTDEDPTTITELTDVSIVKTVIGTGPFTAGTEVDYELTVNVAGPSIARDVVLSDVVPDGLSLVSIGTDDDGWTWDEGVGTRDTLALGEHVVPVTAAIDQAVPAGETLTNTGVVEWTDSDGPNRDDDPEDIGVVTDGDLAISKTAVDAEGVEIDSATAGTELRYTFEVTNHGPSQAVALLEITDELPEGVSFEAVVGDDGGWAVAQDGSQLTFRHPVPLAAGDTAPVLTIATEVAAAVADGAELVNVAQVESVGTDEVSGTPDANPENNEDDTAVSVERVVDLAVDKSHEGEARIGEELTFDLEVRNAGPSEATDVVVLDTLPAGLGYVGAAGEGWEVTADEPGDDGTTAVTATLDGPLAAGVEAPALQITASVTPGAYPTVTNVAEVTSTEPDEDPEDNTSTDEVPVAAQADLAVVKTVDTDRLQVGDTASYVLTVTNHGPTDHVGEIAVSDALPTGLRATAADGPDCEIGEDGTLVECVTSEGLAVGDSFEITVDVEVLAGAWSEESAEAANTAVVTGTSEDPDPENNTSTVVTPVDPDVRFELTKTRGEIEGTTVHWTLTVRSVGLNDAVDGVVVADRLPAELDYEGVTSDAAVECEPGEARLVECLVTGPIPTGESVELTLETTTSQPEDSTVTNVAWLVDPGTGERIPDTEDSAEHRVGGLPVTGVALGSLVALALLLILGGAVMRRRGSVT